MATVQLVSVQAPQILYGKFRKSTTWNKNFEEPETSHVQAVVLIGSSAPGAWGAWDSSLLALHRKPLMFKSSAS